MSNETQEVLTEVEQKLNRISAISEQQRILSGEETEIRGQIKTLMEQKKVKDVVIPRFNADGTPAKGMQARLDDNVLTSVNQVTLAQLLTEEEKAPYTSFSVGVGKLEEALRKGTIRRDNSDEETAIRRCITREVTGKKLVITI